MPYPPQRHAACRVDDDGEPPEHVLRHLATWASVVPGAAVGYAGEHWRAQGAAATTRVNVTLARLRQYAMPCRLEHDLHHWCPAVHLS